MSIHSRVCEQHPHLTLEGPGLFQAQPGSRTLRVRDSKLGRGDPAMSVYVGIDVHRKRSQVAVVTQDGQVQLNKNVVNGSEPMLRLIGDLSSGTPVAFEAAFGWGWLVQLLEDYGFDPHLVHPLLRCKAIASARLKNDLLTELPGVAAAQEAEPSPKPIVGLSE